MPAPYRSDLEPLRARLAAITEELAALGQTLAEHDALRARSAELIGESIALRRELELRERRAPLPLLEATRVASPCHQRWDDMRGDARRRFCGECKKDVYNLSEMPREEAEALLRSAGADLCVRLYRRADGTVLTADCPSGLRARRRRMMAFVPIAAGLVGGASTAFFAHTEAERHAAFPGESELSPGGGYLPAVMGSVAGPDPALTPDPPPSATGSGASWPPPEHRPDQSAEMATRLSLERQMDDHTATKADLLLLRAICLHLGDKPGAARASAAMNRLR